MPLNLITFKGRKYPIHQTIGGASLWIRPLAQYYCVGQGLDIGYYKEGWMLPGAIGIEPTIDPHFDAMRLPKGEFDYVHASHSLEHVKENWPNVLDYWLSKIKSGGILFLYLPHKSQEYWNVENNRKHIHQFDGSEIGDYLTGLGHKVYVSGVDHNNSFVVIAEKCGSESESPFRRYFSLNEMDNVGNYITYEITGDKAKEYWCEIEELDASVDKSKIGSRSPEYWLKLHEIFIKYKPFAKWYLK